MPRRTPSFGRLLLACLLATLLVAPDKSAAAQCAPRPANQPHLSALRGTVRDTNGKALPGVSVSLKDQGNATLRTAQTNSDGAYNFSALPEGQYIVLATIAGYDGSTSQACVLAPGETKNVSLTLELGKDSQTPQFFDEPQFTVAGVTEAANPGGHGSSAIVRTTEAMAKVTASLPPGGPQPATAKVDEESLRRLADLAPTNFDANYRAGKLLVDNGKAGEALSYLDRAAKLNSGSYQQQADLHHLLGEIDENRHDSLQAVQEYQRAAELDATENNLFDWGAELLVHRAYEPAIEVFRKGNQLFPHSARMLIGLGVANYARGSFEAAEEYLCQASDVNPTDSNPYLLMGRLQAVETVPTACLEERFGRFLALQPQNALANYYYAMSLRNRGDAAEVSDTARVRELLEKAVQLDPGLGSAYVQLGILSADQGDLPGAVKYYEQAIHADPALAQAHYRLAEAYRRMGERSKAEVELHTYDGLSKESEETGERERRAIPQFVYTLRNQPSEIQVR